AAMSDPSSEASVIADPGIEFGMTSLPLTAFRFLRSALRIELFAISPESTWRAAQLVPRGDTTRATYPTLGSCMWEVVLLDLLTTTCVRAYPRRPRGGQPMGRMLRNHHSL